MRHNISLSLPPHDSYLILELINDKLHYWQEKEDLVSCRAHLLPSTIEYDPSFIKERIVELRRIRDLYLAAVRQGRITD